MAREKQYRRGLSGDHLFTNPREAAAFVRDMVKQGATVDGDPMALKTIGMQPHHTDEKTPKPQQRFMAEQHEQLYGPVPLDTALPSSNPANPRCRAAGYDQKSQTLRVAWGDGGPDYNYYNVPPQVADEFMNNSASPGRFINSVLNFYPYGVAE